MRPLLLALICLSPITFAYQGEVSGRYSYADESGYEREVYGANATWYFKDVDNRKGPLYEASFLSPQSSVHVSWSNTEIEIPPVFVGAIRPSFANEFTIKTTTVGGRYVFADNRWDIAIEGRRDDQDEPFLGFEETDTYGTSLGYYITPRFKISVGYAWSDESDSASTPIFCPPFFGLDCEWVLTTGLDIEVQEYDIAAKYLHEFKNGWLTAGASYSQTEIETTTTNVIQQITPTLTSTVQNLGGSDEADQYSAQIYGGWYFNNRTGIKATIARVDPEFGDKLMTYRLEGHYFITDSFKLGVNLTQLEQSQLGFENEDLLSAGVYLQLRF